MSTVTINAGSNVRALVFLQDDLLSGSDDGKIRQWRINDGPGVEVGETMNTGGQINSMALSRDGNWIICSGNRVATVWNMRTRQRTLAVNGHSDWVDTVDVSPDSSRFVTGSNDSRVFIWDISTGKRLIGPLQHDDKVRGVKFSLNGDRIATGDGKTGLRIYNAVSGELLRTFQIPITSHPSTPIWWTSAQNIFAISSNTFFHLHADTGRSFSSWKIPGSPVNHHRSIALAGNGRFVASHLGNSISFWDPSTSAQICAVITPPSEVWSSALSLDSKYIASSIVGGVTTIRNLNSIIPVYYLDDQQPPEDGADLRVQVQALRDELRALRSHPDELRSPLMNTQSNNPPHTQTIPRISDGTYRIKSDVSDLYLTRPQDGAGTIVVQPLSQSNIYQRWSVSLADGTNCAYEIMGGSDRSLTVGIRDALVMGGRGTAWNFDSRGNAHVIGNSVNVMAIQFAPNRQEVTVFPRNHDPNQLWVLEPVTN